MRKQSLPRKLFNVFNITFMCALMLITLYPIYYVVCASVSNNMMLMANPGLLIAPLQFTLGAYALAFKHPLLLTGYANTLIILAVSLPINLAMTLLCGYFMAAKQMLYKKYILAFMMFTMFFSGGLIPAYLNIRELGLYNTLWAVILPGALSLYNAIIMKTAIETVPDGLSESAYMDGANDITVLFRIIVPLVMPTLAVMLLYYGVGHWNSWFSASIYLSDTDKMPLQIVLRAILILNSDVFQAGDATDTGLIDRYTETIKYSAVVISTLPIMLMYPFVQKYFVKGVMIGAIKG